MAAGAGRLQEAAGEVRAATVALGREVDDLGDNELTSAVDALTDAMAGRLHEVEAEVEAGAAGVRAARDGYLDADGSAAGGLRRGR